MTETEANELAARIREHFPHVSTVVVQSADMRNAPRNWFIGVQRKESLAEGISLHIHNELEWIEAVQALYVLQKPLTPAPLQATFKPKRDYDPAILDERNPFTPPKIELYPDPATGLWRVAAKQEPPLA